MRSKANYGDMRLFKGEIISNDPELSNFTVFTVFYKNGPVIYINKWKPRNMSEVIRYITHESLHITLYYRVSPKVSANEHLVTLLEYLTWCLI